MVLTALPCCNSRRHPAASASCLHNFFFYCTRLYVRTKNPLDTGAAQSNADPRYGIDCCRAMDTAVPASAEMCRSNLRRRCRQKAHGKWRGWYWCGWFTLGEWTGNERRASWYRLLLRLVRYILASGTTLAVNIVIVWNMIVPSSYFEVLYSRPYWYDTKWYQHYVTIISISYPRVLCTW